MKSGIHGNIEGERGREENVKSITRGREREGERGSERGRERE
jgi:hypothetical protein